MGGCGISKNIGKELTRLCVNPLLFCIYFGGFRYLVQPPAALFLYRQKEGKKRLKGLPPL